MGNDLVFQRGGVGSEFSELLEAAGVDTVPELANRNVVTPALLTRQSSSPTSGFSSTLPPASMSYAYSRPRLIARRAQYPKSP